MNKVEMTWGDETAMKSQIKGLHFDGDRQWKKCEVLITGHKNKSTHCDVTISINGKQAEEEEFRLSGTDSHRMKVLEGIGSEAIDIGGFIENDKTLKGAGADIHVSCYY